MNSISTLLKVSVGALLLPLFGGLWLTYLNLQVSPSPWAEPGEALKERLENQLIFAFSPLVEWVNQVEKGGTPEAADWEGETAALFEQSKGLQEVAWFVSEQGTPKVFRHASRNAELTFAADSLDSEIFQYVKSGQRPVAFAYPSKSGPLFEFQAPLHAGNLFLGIIVARYHLPELLTPLLKEAPPHLSLVLWNRDSPLNEVRTKGSVTSTFIPIEAWGKKLTAEIRAEYLGPQRFLALQWLGFLALMLIVCVVVAWRRPRPVLAPEFSASSEWFKAVAPAAAPVAPAPGDDGKLPVWAIAQQERIQGELKKNKG